MFGTYRTLLALMVVALHIGGLPNIGAYAVFGFYCLSGYLMTLVMHSTYGYTPSGIAKYAVNRLLRIFPIYWVSLLMSVLLIWHFGNAFTANYHPTMFMPVTLIEWARNIFLYFPFREVPRLTPPAWALTVELFFYILIGLGISKSKLVTLTWFLFSVLYHLYALIAQWGWVDRYFTIAAASLPFATGAVIYHFKSQIIPAVERFFPKSKHVYFPFLVAVAIFMNWAIGRVLGQLTGLFFYSNYFLCSLMVLILSGKKELPFISRKFDKWMGDLSYPIYLIHYQVAMLVVALLTTLGININRPDEALMTISIPAILFVAWLIAKFIEQPMDRIRQTIKQ